MPSYQTPSRPFYLGVEYAYGNNQTNQIQIAQVKALVDRVKDYTNLFVMGSVGLTFNSTALSEACDYIYNAKLNFIVLFTGIDMYTYNITDWMKNATLKYGDQFLGIYRYDEPGGNQLDNGAFQLITSKSISPNASYAEVANAYVGNLSFFPKYYLQFSPKIFTADYGLYWFDYKANYTDIFAEFVGNESRQRHIALCRGAADAFGKDWGVIINWKYTQKPYLESAIALREDLALAYNAGAKYAVVFSYPNVTDYGTLTEEHFAALQGFWQTLHSNPASLGKSEPPTVAYVLPADYGFGFRSTNDTIWGLFPPDTLSQKVYDDVDSLMALYDAHLDILYDEPQITPLLHCYSQVFYWNQTIP
jgi:hypothetical protein